MKPNEDEDIATRLIWLAALLIGALLLPSPSNAEVILEPIPERQGPLGPIPAHVKFHVGRPGDIGHPEQWSCTKGEFLRVDTRLELLCVDFQGNLVVICQDVDYMRPAGPGGDSRRGQYAVKCAPLVVDGFESTGSAAKANTTTSDNFRNLQKIET